MLTRVIIRRYGDPEALGWIHVRARIPGGQTLRDVGDDTETEADQDGNKMGAEECRLPGVETDTEDEEAIVETASVSHLSPDKRRNGGRETGREQATYSRMKHDTTSMNRTCVGSRTDES